ncbi:MAG: glycosyltransferase, partial [Myxococcota bacterium]
MNTSAPRFVVVIPTKDDAPTVGDVVRRALARVSDVLVVDDGSTDRSGEVAREAGAVVLTHPVNQGKGAALLTAFRWAAERGYTHAVTVDADGQHHPEEIPRFVDAATAEPTAIVAGSRDMRTAPERSRFGRRFSNFWVWAETGWDVEDTQCGYRVYPIGPVLALGLRGGRYELEVEVLVRALWAGIPVIDLACDVYYPPVDERHSSFRPLADNVRISLLNTRLVVERVAWPPRWRRHAALRTDQWRDRHRGTFVGWWIVVTLIRWTGRWPAYAVVTGLAAWFAVFAGGPRRAVAAYGRRLGRGTLGSTWLMVRVFQAFAVSLVDRFLLLTRGADGFRFDRSEVGGAYDAVRDGKGLVVLSAHVGN